MPERPGTTMIPSFELAYFDPATKQYAVAKSDPLRHRGHRQRRR